MNDTTEATATNLAVWKRDDKEKRAPLDARLLSAELYLAEPVRKGVAYPRQRNYHGYYWMASTGAHVWHESLHERDWLMWLDFAGDTVAVASQPMKLTGSDGVIRYPDFLALDARGVQTVYDVKPAARITTKVHTQFEWTRDLCQDIGWDYRVLAGLIRRLGDQLPRLCTAHRGRPRQTLGDR